MKANPSTTPHEAALLASAIQILKSDPRQDECILNTPLKGVDTAFQIWSNAVSTPSTLDRRNTMATTTKAKAKAVPSKAAIEAAADAVKAELAAKYAPAGHPEIVPAEVDEDGNTVTHNPPPKREPTKKEIHEAEAATKRAERAIATAAREARLAELGKNYKGSMLALVDKVKSGTYVKGATGQLRSTTELAVVLDGVLPNGVIQLAKAVLNLDKNPYAHLNVGQQSMNLRNRMRGAITKGTLTIDVVKAAVDEMGLDSSAHIAEEAAAKAKAKADRKEVAAAKESALNQIADAESA